MVEKGGDKDLHNKKRGCKTLLHDDFMKRTIDAITGLQIRGAPVSAAIINSVAKGNVIVNDHFILVEISGYTRVNHQLGRSNNGKNIGCAVHSNGE